MSSSTICHWSEPGGSPAELWRTHTTSVPDCRARSTRSAIVATTSAAFQAAANAAYWASKTTSAEFGLSAGRAADGAAVFGAAAGVLFDMRSSLIVVHMHGH